MDHVRETVVGLTEVHAVLQLLLKRRRIAFMKMCARELPQAYVENRFHREMYRNQFEVIRAWTRCTKDFLSEVHRYAETFPTLLQAVPRVLLEDGIALQDLRMNAPTSDQRETVEALVKRIETYQDETLKSRITLAEDAAVGRRERDVQFMRLMIEMLDEAEQMENQKRETDS